MKDHELPTASVQVRSAPRGIRTPNLLIRREHDRVSHGLSQHLYQHDRPRRPCQTPRFNFISCHEPCHAAALRMVEDRLNQPAWRATCWLLARPWGYHIS